MLCDISNERVLRVSFTDNVFIGSTKKLMKNTGCRVRIYNFYNMNSLTL